MKWLIGIILAFAPGVAAANLDQHFNFDLPAGEADPALRLLAAQSAQQVIYPAELVQGVRTRQAKGSFTAKQALDRMLEGTGLLAWEDEQTGALAIGRAPAAARDQPIELPPFVVAESIGQRWRYASTPGVEVLSRCADPITNSLIAQHHILHELLEIILPRKLQFRSDVPTAYIFFNAGDKAAITEDLLASLRKRETEIVRPPSAGDPGRTAPAAVQALPNYRFWDQDALAIFVLWEDALNVGGHNRLRLTPSYVRYLLDRRAPALPPWFIQGIADLYAHTAMSTVAPNIRGDEIDTPFQRYAITLRPQLWVSVDLTLEVLKRPKAKVEMLQLGELFADRRVLHRRLTGAELDGVDGERVSHGVIRLPDFVVGERKLPQPEADYYERVRRSEVELFIRWMLDGGKPERRRALWTLVERASGEPMTEALFQDCIGLDYDQMEMELQAYVRSACREDVVLHPATMPETGLVELRDATVAEVSRIKGDFNRLEIPYVRQLYPALTGKYVEQARSSLRRSYDAGDRDPRLLAELGLCECDAGNDAGAVPFLEAAMKGKVVRPRAYYELARIRFAAFPPSGPEGKFTPAQLSGILEPLFMMRGQAPVLAETYDLMAEAWLRCDAAPTREQLAYLGEGTRIFPRRPRLLISVAWLNFAQGHMLEAERLVDQGLNIAADPADHARFQRLKDEIDSGREGER